LEYPGFEAEAVFNGEQAIEAAKRFRPDFLLTDYAMPGINGLDLAVEIQTLLPACRIVLLSGHELISRSVPHEKKGYSFVLLSKPIPPGALLEAFAANRIQALHRNTVRGCCTWTTWNRTDIR
jgi:CheY-like chemotaxis protein